MPPKDAVNENRESRPRDADTGLRDAIDSMQEAFALFGADDRLVFCNEAYTRIHPLGKKFIRPGVPFEDIIRTNVEKGNVADAFGREEEYILERMDLHRNPKGPIYRRMANGSAFIINESRTPDGFTLFTSTEVTELKLIEEALRDSQERLSDAMESIIDGVALFDAADNFVFCNTPFRETLQYMEDVLVPGTPFETIARAAGERKLYKGDKDGLEKYMRRRMAEHKERKPVVHYYPETDSSVIVQEYETSDGGTFIVRTDITELKRAEGALRESEERHRDLIHGSVMGIVIDRDGKPLFANQAYADLFGYDGPDDILALKKLDVLYAPGDQSKIKKYRKARLKEEEVPDLYEFEGVRKDGSKILLESRFRVVTWEGKPATQSTLIDITERKKAEDALRESQELLHDAMESIDGGIALFDAEDRFVLCNSTYRENLREIDHVLAPGYTYEELLRAYAEKGINTEAKADPEKYVRERLARHRKLETSAVQITKTGDWIMLREYRTSEGGTLIIRTDVTKLKKAETALKESEARFRDIADAASDHFWEMGPDLRYTFASERIYEKSGLTPEDIIGKTWREIVGPERIKENPEFWKAHEKDLENRKPFRNFEYSLKLPNGQVRYLSVSGKPFFDRDGIFMGYRGASADITDYRNAQRDLAQHNKMESLGHLAGGIAHNLNNMLQPILILGQMTKDSLENGSREHHNLEVICRAGASARELVERISTFSRQQGLIREPANIFEIVRDGLNLFGLTVPPSITLKEDLDLDMGLVFVDAAQIQTVLMNLVANAVDSMEGINGELSISLSRVLVDATSAHSIPGLVNGVYAKLTIADTGHGMDEETLTRIFDPFFTTKGFGKGTGLGLSSAFGIIQKHGGTIRAVSAPETGTAFEVYLPLEQSDKT